MPFDLHIGIDYSGAETAESRLRALQVFSAIQSFESEIPSTQTE